MGCCGSVSYPRNNKAGQIPIELEQFDGDTVPLIYQLPGIQLNVKGPVTGRWYKVTQNQATVFIADDAAVLLTGYDARRRTAAYRKLSDAEIAEAEEPEQEPKPRRRRGRPRKKR